MMDVLMAHPALAPYAIWLVSMISVASAIDCALPQPAAGSRWILPRRLVSYAGLNFGNAVNLRGPATETWLLTLLGVALRAVPAGSSSALVGLIVERLIRVNAGRPLMTAPVPVTAAAAPAVVIVSQSAPATPPPVVTAE